MANNFEIDKANIIAEALVKVGAIDSLDSTIPGNEFDSASKSLNLIILHLSNKGIQLWNTETKEYTFTSPDIPVKTLTPPTDTISVEMMKLVDGNGKTVRVLNAMTEDDYFGITDQDATGKPHSYFYDSKYPSPTIYVYPCLDDENYTIKCIYASLMNSLDDNSDTADLPKSFRLALVYMLASDLADSYQLPLRERTYLQAKAKMFLDEAYGALINKQRGDRFVYPLDAFI